MSGHFLTPYPFRIGREAVAYFIPEAFQSLYSKMSERLTLFVFVAE